MAPHRYTKEEVEFLKETYSEKSSKETTVLFNERFKTDLSYGQIEGAIRNRKMKNGRDCRFKKGVRPSERTEFKKGVLAPHRRPVGSERTRKDGYTQIKTANPSVWRFKHIVIWESVYGKVPEGYKITFADRDKSNLDLSNLILISKKQSAVMGAKGLYKDDAELTKMGVVIADLYLKAAEMKRQMKGVKSQTL